MIAELADFDVSQQLPQDLMHVILEGVFPLHMEQLLQYIDQTSNVMTIDEINCRIAAFPYNYFNTKPAPLRGCDITKGAQSGIYI